MPSLSKSSFIVSKTCAGKRLQQVVQAWLGDVYSGKQIKRLIDSYACRVNGKIELFASYRVSSGDQISLDLARPVNKQIKSSLEILYEDEEMLICNKPSFCMTDEKLFRRMLHQDKIYLVHRLDKGTTGVILLAKSISMKKKLEHLFKHRSIHKEYHALVEGKVSKNRFKVENTLGKICEYEGQSLWGELPTGDYALTYFELKKKNGVYALMGCQPITGRTHQIRVHLSQTGLPILGDYHYSKEKPFSYSAARSLLHAYLISFIHPKDGKKIEIKAPYPEDFSKALYEIGLCDAKS